MNQSSIVSFPVSKISECVPFVEALKKGTLVPFCGAGLSYQCPSHIPLAWDLKKSIFMSYCKGSEILDKIFMKFSSASSREWSFSQLPLEFMLEGSYAEGIRDFDRVLAFMRDA